MNSLTKSTFPLFESVCVVNGTIQNTAFHEKRFQYAYYEYFRNHPKFELFDHIEIPLTHQQHKVKLRISYGEAEKEHIFQPYQKKEKKTLKLVSHDAIDYHLKLEEREPIHALYALKGNCDDVLIVKQGHITDSSYANIIFWDGKTWYTPSTYLLKGTKRSQLLHDGLIRETPIELNDLERYQGFQLINAMLDFNPRDVLPISNIKR